MIQSLDIIFAGIFLKIKLMLRHFLNFNRQDKFIATKLKEVGCKDII